MSRSIGFSFIAALFGAIILISAPASAGPAGTFGVSGYSEDASLVQNVGWWKRRYWRRDYNGDEHVDTPGAIVDTGPRATNVEAPFTSVQTRRAGTWVRAPFVNLFVPRNDWD